MKGVLTFAVLLSMSMLALPVQALEPFVLYEDFSSKWIDVAKWSGGQERRGGAVPMECVREIQGSRLHLANRTYGETTSNRGTSRGFNFLRFADEGRITAMKATVQVNDVDVKGCKANPVPSTVSLQLMGSFFNTTATPTPNSVKNDVIAWIGIQRRSNATDKPNVLEVNYMVVECGGDYCIPANVLDKGFLGIVMTGSLVEMSVRWDQANHQFIFQLDGQSAIFSPYHVSDTSRPGNGFKRVNVGHDIPNCTGEPRPIALMDAYFHKVFINEKVSP